MFTAAREPNINDDLVFPTIQNIVKTEGPTSRFVYKTTKQFNQKILPWVFLVISGAQVFQVVAESEEE